MNTAVMAFVFNSSENWKTSDADSWDLQSIELDGSEKVLGHKKIDGCICKVIVTFDNKIVAISK